MSVGISKKRRMSAEVHCEKLLRKIAKASADGRTRRANELARQFLRSFDAKLLAVMEANRKLRQHRRVGEERMLEIVEKIDAWNGTEEKTLVNIEEKENKPGHFRPTFDFGIEHRSLQYLVASVLRPQVSFHPAQYLNEKGRHKAVRRVLACLDLGYRWVTEIDVRNCYPSFNGEKVQEILPLPKEVIRNVILSESLHLSPGSTIYHRFDMAHDAPDEEWLPLLCLMESSCATVRQGIPQGSAVSSLVCEALLAPVLGGLPKLGQIVNYGDNTLILAKAKNDASSMATALSEALASHPVGPLWSNPSDLVAPGHPFDFLGYTVECGADEYSVRPSDRNRVKFDHELHALINGIKRSRRRGQVPKKKIDRAHNVVRGWANAFAHWDGAERAKNKAFALIEMTAGDS